MAITIILQGSEVTNLKSDSAIKALVICVRLSFFMNAAASFAAAENILSITNKGYSTVGERPCRYAFMGVICGAVFFLVTTWSWMWTHVFWAKMVTALTILCISGWGLYSIKP